MVLAAIAKLSEGVTDCSQRLRAMELFSADCKSATAAQMMTHRADIVRMVGQHQEKQRVAIEEIKTYVHRNFEDIQRRLAAFDLPFAGAAAMNRHFARMPFALDPLPQGARALLAHEVMALQGLEDDNEGDNITWETVIEQPRQAAFGQETGGLDPEAQEQ
jgi:hypothetical protein